MDARTARVVFTLLLFALGLGFLYVARETLMAFLFAIFFAYLIDPLVSHLDHLAKGRGRAIAAIYVFLLVLIVVFFFFVGPRVAREGGKLSASLPQLLSRVSSGEIASQIGMDRGWSKATQELLRDFLVTHSEQIKNLAQRAGIRIAEAARKVWLIFLVPILAAFFLKDGRSFTGVLVSFVPSKPQREFLEGVIADLNHMLAHFIRSQIILAALSLVVYLSVLSLLRAPYALVLGTAGGMMEFVPVVGPLLAGLVMIGVAVLMSYPHWVLLVLFLGSWRLVQDYLVAPRVMGEKMELHPLAAIFGVLAGGEIAGVLGVYLSIPVMASLRIVWRRWQLYSEKKRFGPLNEYVFGAAEMRPRF
ncbi:MAG: AI-2E family transporter [Acidobacteria bacterium]|nr:AI-2E family transporter [Acidobacteriota bacterium]MBV8890619.1 AI-2E family transporter [Acidobacteriota bacterium]MBV9481344.1 AI-2E family transporter [Acidobacteriota bacterium]